MKQVLTLILLLSFDGLLAQSTLFVGENVEPDGNIVVGDFVAYPSSSCDFVVDSKYYIFLGPGFEVQKGSSFEAKVLGASIQGEVYNQVNDEGPDLKALINEKEKVMVYPNPSNGFFKVKLPQDFGRNRAGKVVVYNSGGQIVYQKEGNNIDEMEMSIVGKGVYLVVFQMGTGENFSSRVIIH